MPNPILAIAFSAPLALAIHLAPVGHADPCTPLFNTMNAMLKVPYATRSIKDGKLSGNEAIVANGNIYIQIEGKWRSMPHPIADEEAKIEEAKKDPKKICRQEADSIVNGEATSVYFGRITNDDVTSDNRLWISKRTGLLLKTETKIDEGPAVAAMYRYDHIQAPPVVAKQ